MINFQRLAKFAAVGVSNTGLDFLIYSSFVFGLSIDPTKANLISYSAGLINSFILNRSWTFNETSQRVSPTFAMFAIANLVGLGLSTAIIFIAEPMIDPISAKLLAILGTSCWNYFWSAFIFGRYT